jgi:hypothetical protein
MNKTKLILILILIAVVGIAVYMAYNSSGNKLSEEEAAKVALQAAIDDGRKDTLKPECATPIISVRDGSIVAFNIHELHSEACGGDPDTAPIITSVLIDLKTGKVVSPAQNAAEENKMPTYSGTTKTGITYSIKYYSNWVFYKFNCGADGVAFWPKEIAPNFSSENVCGLKGFIETAAIVLYEAPKPSLSLFVDKYANEFNEMQSTLTY